MNLGGGRETWYALRGADGAQHGLGDHPRSPGSHDVRGRRHGRGVIYGGGEDDVAIDGGMNRRDGTREAIVGHLGYLGGGGLGEARVGRDYSQRGISFSPP